MNKIKKIWLGISRRHALPKQFTKDYLLDCLNFWKDNGGYLDFHSTGDSRGVILRHDIDKDLDKAVRMAEIEAGILGDLNKALFEHGNHRICKATYFVLNTRTSGYWGSLEMDNALKYIQDLGHEIGWHNNAITEHIETGKDIQYCIKYPLDYLRALGLTITGTAAHGDRLCKKWGYLNYNVFGFKSAGWNYWDTHEYSLAQFGLEYEAYHVPFDGYLADCHHGWNVPSGHPERSLPEDWEGRIQVVIHPQNWRL